ncbi:MAG: DUF4070 domain-containing protein [Syntrophorhabdales bacterium]|jgi:radical SAM superfamily enzyme YgiQ (UPF0313 family)
MNILLVYPKYPDTFWSFKHALRFISKKALHPPLGLLTVAAMLPVEWEKRLIDMNTDSIRDRDLLWADCVFIGAMAVQKKSANELIARCKAAGIKIVAGGPLFTASPDEFPDVDHLVLDEAENSLPPFLEDMARGKAQRIYRSGAFPELDKTPTPLWNLIKMRRYFSMNLQYSRGCPFSCEFCDITTLYGNHTRTKSAQQIVDELEALYKAGWRGSVFFVDDNFIGNKKRLKEQVLPAMVLWMKKRRHPFDFSTEASINLADDEPLMRQMIRAGFDSVFVGIETPDDKSLKECSKFQNTNRDLVASVKRIQEIGLRVRAGFIVGFDSDSPDIFDRQIKFVQESRIVTAMVGMLNAPGGSRLYQRLQKEGRLGKEITGDNTDFTTNVVPLMGYEKLFDGYKRIINGIYSPRMYYERVKAFLKEYRPLEKRRSRFHFGSVRFNLRYLDAPFKTLVVLGIKDNARLYYWKLLLWSLLTRPRLLPMAITYHVYGFHFRRVLAVDR